MKRAPISCVLCFPLLLGSFAANGQTSSQKSASAPASPSAAPVPYSSVSELNMMLSQVEQASQSTQLDLAKMRIERWKTDGGSKRQTQGNVESVERNLQSALPEMIAQLRAAPEDLNATFKLYRNLDALYGVLGSVAESAGAFGTKDEFQSLENDLSSFERSRKAFADRMEALSSAKETELAHLRVALQNAQAAKPEPAPKKVIVDDTEPAKKPAPRKKPASKPSTAQPGAVPGQPQPAPQNPPKPQ